MSKSKLFDDTLSLDSQEAESVDSHSEPNEPVAKEKPKPANLSKPKQKNPKKEEKKEEKKQKENPSKANDKSQSVQKEKKKAQKKAAKEETKIQQSEESQEEEAKDSEKKKSEGEMKEKKKGGYLFYLKDYMDAKKAELGEKFERKDHLESAQEAWKTLDAQVKLDKYGVKPQVEKPESTGPKPNYIIYRSQQLKIEKEKLGDAFQMKEFDEATKEKWGKMGDEEKQQYLPPELSEEEKALRQEKKEKKKAKKLALKEEEKKKQKIEKDLKTLVNKKKKGGNKNDKKESSDEESDDDQIKENKKGASNKKEKSTKKDKNTSAYKDAKKTKDMSPLKKEAKPMSEEDQKEYLKAFEKHKDKKPFDVPVKMTKHGQEKPSSTTINKELKNLKCIMIVNVASKCGHTSKHYQQLTELYNKYKDKGFSVFAFPCDQYGGQEPLDFEEVSKNMHEKFQAEFPFFEKVLCAGAAQHPIFKHLNILAKQDAIGWNFDKFLIGPKGKLLQHGTAKNQKPLEFEKEIEAAISS